MLGFQLAYLGSISVLEMSLIVYLTIHLSATISCLLILRMCIISNVDNLLTFHARLIILISIHVEAKSKKQNTQSHSPSILPKRPSLRAHTFTHWLTAQD